MTGPAIPRKLLAALVGFGITSLATGSVPDRISYQGKLVLADGTPVAAPTTLRFRLLRGGDASTYPSTGTLLYHETALVSPESDGVFAWMIGTGTPASDCPEGTCQLIPGDFASGQEPLYIEIMVDPDGQLGTGDDDVLLPRTLVGTVGYAYRVASLEGAVGGQLTGDLNTSGSVTAAGNVTTQGDVAMTVRHGVWWPTHYTRCNVFNGPGTPCTSFSGSVDSFMTIGVKTGLSPDPYNSQDGVNGQANNILMWGYNVNPANGGRLTSTEPKFVQSIESSYYDGVQQLVEHNWDYQNGAGVQWRPLYLGIRTAPAGGVSPSLDAGDLQIRMCATCANLNLNSAGNANIGNFDASNDFARLNVRQEVVGLTNGNDHYGTYTNLSFRPAAAMLADVTAGVTGRTAWDVPSISTASTGFLTGVQAYSELMGSSSEIRTVRQYAAGLDARCWIAPGGTGGGTSNCFGARVEASAHGTGTFNVPTLAGLLVASPGTKGTGITVTDGAGIRIHDQKGYGDRVQGSLVIDSQTGGSGTGAKGNLLMSGGGFDSGHLVLDLGHLWYDRTNATFKVNDAPPTSGADGRTLVTSTGSPSHGLLKWGSGTDPAMDTGNAVCEASGLTCVIVKSPNGGPDSNCTKHMAPQFFYVMCK